MIHHEPAEKEIEDPQAIAATTRIGLILFAIYTAVYIGFVVVNTFASGLIESVEFAGLNLAILYGLGLIVLAFVQAMLYGWLCRNR